MRCGLQKKVERSQEAVAKAQRDLSVDRQVGD
jgi:hypothetical protein